MNVVRPAGRMNDGYSVPEVMDVRSGRVTRDGIDVTPRDPEQESKKARADRVGFLKRTGLTGVEATNLAGTAMALDQITRNFGDPRLALLVAGIPMGFDVYNSTQVLRGLIPKLGRVGRALIGSGLTLAAVPAAFDKFPTAFDKFPASVNLAASFGTFVASLAASHVVIRSIGRKEKQAEQAAQNVELPPKGFLHVEVETREMATQPLRNFAKDSAPPVID